MTIIITVCVIASFIAGVVDSIAGGGGLIALPAMLLTGVPPHIALGTGKFASTMGTSLALFNFARNNLVMWRIALIGVVFSLLGAYCGSLMALLISSEYLAKILVALLPVGMLITLMPKKEKEQSGPAELVNGAKFWVFVPLVSFAVGGYDGFFGPGAGSFFILAFHWVLRMGLIEASATAKVFNLASNFGALVAFLWNGKVWFALGIPMALASMAGNWVGSKMAIKAGPAMVRKFLTVSMLMLLATLVYRYFIAG